MANIKEEKSKVSIAKSYLEIITNVAVVLVAAVIVFSFASSFFVPRRTVQPEVGLRKGIVLGHIANVDYNAAPQTLLLLMNTECRYCEQSIPFYKKLAATNGVFNHNTKMVALFSDPPERVAQYTHQNQLTFQTIPSAPSKSLEVFGTPTLILANREGRILDFWIGKLTSESEKEVLNAVGNLN